MLSRRALLSWALPAIAAGATANAAEAPAGGGPKLYLFNVPAQALQTALIAYAGVVGTQIIYDAGLARNLRSLTVVGLFTADTALRLLISGTEFTVVNMGPDVALVPLAEIRAGHWPGENSGGDMTLVLDTLYVAVPPGAEQRPDFGEYGMLLRTRIRDALTRDPGTARRIYNARFDVSIGPKGGVSRAQITRSSGQARMDATLRRVIEQIVVERPPPRGMPQPVHITVIGI